MGGDTHQHTQKKESNEECFQKLLYDRGTPEVEVKRGGDRPPLSPTSSTSSTSTYTYKKGGWGARHTVVVLCCSAVILISMMRYSFSIVIVSMVNRPPHASPHAPTTLQDGAGHGVDNSSGDSIGGACPAPPTTTLDLQYNKTDTGFDWDERTQGLLLGSFYYGNVLTNVLGGRMSEKVGSKPVILLGLFLSSVFSLLSPVAAYLSTNVFVAVRLGLGLAQGIVMPAISRFLVLWVPPHKRSKYQTMVFIGSETGVVLSLSAGGWLCSQPFLGGWPAVFYVFGGAGVVWCVAWVLVIHETPEQHTRITSEEKKYLMSHCIVRQEKMSVPWRQVVVCLPFWAIAIMHMGNNWGYYTFVTELPAYLSNMQHFSIKSNGLISALPYLIKTSFALLFCLVMDRVTARGLMSVLAVRRTSMVVATFLPAAALIGMCFVGCNSVASVAVVSAAIGVTATAYCGVFCSHQDISPQFAGTLYGVTNTLGNIMGFVSPAVIGFITYNNQTVQAWNTVFLITALVYVVTGTFYITCISDQVQAFNFPSQVKEVEEGLANGKEETKKEETHTSQLLTPSPK